MKKYVKSANEFSNNSVYNEIKSVYDLCSTTLNKLNNYAEYTEKDKEYIKWRDSLNINLSDMEVVSKHNIDEVMDKIEVFLNTISTILYYMDKNQNI